MDKEKTIRYVNKNQNLYKQVNKVRLWPSRSGILHGIRQIENRGSSMIITTHCGEQFTVWNSRNSRSARWLRKRWCTHPCPKCHVPDWKLEKYAQTVFSNLG